MAVLAAACGSGDDAADIPYPLVTPAAEAPDVTSGAGDDETHGGSVQVAAASDLHGVLDGLVDDIDEVCQTEIVTVYGSSGQLKEQVLAGADYGLFLSADAAFPAELDDEGLVVPGGRASYAVGRLALVTREGVPPAQAVEDLSSPAYEHITIANPGHAPYGVAAREALENAGIYEDVADRIVLGENVRQSFDYAITGNADAGLVAWSLAVADGVEHVIVDERLHEPIEQGGAVIRGPGAELDARCVFQYLLNPAGQEHLAANGFERAGVGE